MNEPMTLRVFFYLLICFIVPAAFSQEANRIADTLQQLRQIKVEFNEAEVPATAIPLLTRLKHDLLALFQRVLNASGPDVKAAAAHEELLRRLQAAGVQLKDVDKWEGIPYYGYLYALDVSQPSGHSDLLLFRSEISIACGTDNSVYIFQKRQERWKVVIAVESNGYKKIFGGLSNPLYYEASPPDADGHWFLVYAHEYPQCAGNWNAIHFLVVRPGATPQKPVVLLSREESIFEYDAHLKITKDGFRLDFGAFQHLDAGFLVRSYVFRYRIAGNRATRIPPLADSPGGFLDEWSRMPPRKAARWSRIPEFPRTAHHMLGNQSLYHEFAFLQRCPGGNKWQIGVKVSQLYAPNSALGTLVATVVREGDNYFITQLGYKRPGGCPGDALVDESADAEPDLLK